MGLAVAAMAGIGIVALKGKGAKVAQTIEEGSKKMSGSADLAGQASKKMPTPTDFVEQATKQKEASIQALNSGQATYQKQKTKQQEIFLKNLKKKQKQL